MRGTVGYDIAQLTCMCILSKLCIFCILCILLTCMCSTELKALFDPASGRDPSLEKMIANDKQDTINQI